MNKQSNTVLPLSIEQRIATALHGLSHTPSGAEDAWNYEGNDWTGESHCFWLARVNVYVEKVREATTSPCAGMFDRGLDLDTLATSLELAAAAVRY